MSRTIRHRHFIARPSPAPNDARDELVTVVVPAYNAGRTIDETLRSIRGQSHRNLEILVVDDGSTDGTAEVVRRHAAADPRIRLIVQPNAGVARARNAGIAVARGDFIALVDADDLWRWDKVARQLEAFRQGGERIGLVYTWFALIDEDNRIVHARPRPPVKTDLLHTFATRNIVGNGSSAMVRKAAVLAVGGYDPSLRDRGAQGCEDWKFYFQMAERYDFALVPEYLTGYRELKDSMSSDALRMLRSRDLCMSEFAVEYPQLRANFRRGRSILMRFMLHGSLRGGDGAATWRLFKIMLRHDPLFALWAVAGLPVRAAIALARRLCKAAGRSDRYFDWRAGRPQEDCASSGLAAAKTG